MQAESLRALRLAFGDLLRRRRQFFFIPQPQSPLWGNVTAEHAPEYAAMMKA